jgi:hypothetical protein
LISPLRVHWFQSFRHAQSLESVHWHVIDDNHIVQYVTGKVLEETLLNLLPRHKEGAACVFIKASIWSVYGLDEGENDERDSEDSGSDEDEDEDDGEWPSDCDWDD